MFINNLIIAKTGTFLQESIPLVQILQTREKWHLFTIPPELKFEIVCLFIILLLLQTLHQLRHLQTLIRYLLLVARTPLGLSVIVLCE